MSRSRTHLKSCSNQEANPSLECRMMINRVNALFVALISMAASAQNPVTNDDQARLRAQALIKQARAVIAGEQVLRNILTLSTSGKSRRIIKYVSVQSPKKVIEKEKTLDGDLDLDFAFPDKFR